MKSIHRYGILILLMFSFHLGAQETNYVATIRAYYKQLNQKMETSGQQVHHLKYTETVVSQKNDVTEDDVDVYVGKGQYGYYSEDVEIVQGQGLACMVVHKDQKVYLSSVVKGISYEGQFKLYLSQLEKFFAEGKVLLSEKVVLNGRNIARVSIKTPEGMDSRLKVIRTTIWFDLDKEQVWKTKIDYDDSYSIRSKTTTYETIDLDISIKAQKKAFVKVVDKKGNLVAPYTKYTLIKKN